MPKEREPTCPRNLKVTKMNVGFRIGVLWWRKRINYTYMLYGYLGPRLNMELNLLLLLKAISLGFFNFFAEGSELQIETLPPESTIARLTVPKGFQDEKEARMVLEQYVKVTGAPIDWSKPKEELKGNEREVTYGTSNPDDNIFAGLKYKNGKLVELRFSMAL